LEGTIFIKGENVKLSKLSKQGWAVALLGMGSAEVLEGMQEQVAPIVGAYTTATPEEQKELLTEMLNGLSWLGSLIGDVSIKIENELESLK
jgi:hypothetical protein